MDLKKYFNIGDRIQVIPLDRKIKAEYVSQIADIFDGILDIFNPIYKSSLVYFRNDEALRIIVSKKEAVYEFDTKVLDKSFGKIPLIRLKIVSELNKIQRRGYYRLKITKTIKLRKIDKNKNEEDINSYYEGILADISGGGMLLFSKYDLDKNDLVEIEIKINENKMIILYGVVRRKQFDIGKSFLYEYGIEFQNMKNADREALIKFIFDEQRKLLKRGMI